MDDVRRSTDDRAVFGGRRFFGPLFVVGLPRSGTKLLRDLLNRHSSISLAEVESEFLPLWVQWWRNYGDLADAAAFRNFYRANLRLPYFQHMQRKGRLIEEGTWYTACSSYGVAEVFEALIRHDAGVSYGDIWGDKSPSYIADIPLLTRVFPSARFIHIVRDARDHCLSINRAWGKNQFRAAWRWQEALTRLLKDVGASSAQLEHVRYEDLLADPRRELVRLCSFLDVSFEERMLCLPRPSENIGDARGQRGIVSGNARKFMARMPDRNRMRIEAIAGDVLLRWGYDMDPGVRRKSLSRLMLALYRVADGINLLRADSRDLGLLGAARMHYGFSRIARSRR